ncbi:unnamed protein product [Boreogadus saida]
MATDASAGQIVAVFTAFVCVALLLLVACRRRRRPLRAEEEEEGAGRGVLVTGCDSGFGHHLALQLDARGFTVFAGCLFPEGRGALTLAQEGSCRLRVLKLDVTSDEDVEEAKRVVQINLPENGLWAVVNNAGISDWAETEWSTINHYTKMVDVNLFGAIRTTIAFLPLVRAAKGRMVFMSSIFAFFHCLNMGAYSVSKRGLEAFADCLRVEMASFGVKVSIVQPGNFGRATNIVKTKKSWNIWENLTPEQKLVFSREYMELANAYFNTVTGAGFTEVSMVVDALLHAVSSPRPQYHYLLASRLDSLFFSWYPLLPTAVSDGIFALSPMYARRRKMLYSKQ